MRLIYDLIFLFSFLLYLPVLFIKKKISSGFLLRLGFLPKDLRLDKPVWIHAVSVGEINSTKALLKKIREKYPHISFVLSTITSTGNKVAQGLAKEKDFVTYLPLDISFLVRRVIKRIKPRIFIIVETEIWPNLINVLYKEKVPIVLINGRISQRSFKGYKKIKIFLRPILNKINKFCVQTKTDAERLLNLGVDPSRLEITGNMKFDLIECLQLKSHEISLCKERLSLKEEEHLLVCGSTHPGEEKIILSVYKEIKDKFPDLKILIAPRHPQRVKEIARLVKKNSFKPIFLSKPSTPEKDSVFILDTVGELITYYFLARIVFVGGSLVKRGGHNILEPAVFSKPIIIGPYMYNFSDIVEVFIKEECLILVRNKDEFKRKLEFLLSNLDFTFRLGAKASRVAGQYTGATERNISIMKRFLFRK